MPAGVRLAAGVLALAYFAIAACSQPSIPEMHRQPSLSTTVSPREPPPGTVPIGGDLRIDREKDASIPGKPAAAGANPFHAKALYDVYCAPCHGLGGDGHGVVTNYYDRRPGIRLPADLTRETIQAHSDGWLFATITNGAGQMPPFRFELTSFERWQVVTAVRSLRAAEREPAGDVR